MVKKHIESGKKPGEAKKTAPKTPISIVLINERKLCYSICKGPRITLPRGPEFFSAALNGVTNDWKYHNAIEFYLYYNNLLKISFSIED